MLACIRLKVVAIFYPYFSRKAKSIITLKMAAVKKNNNVTIPPLSIPFGFILRMTKMEALHKITKSRISSGL